MQVRKDRITTHRISCLNWPDLFPAAPEVSFDIWHDGASMHIVYHVREAAVRAECTSDRDHVWEDSCVEFFVELPGTGTYVNLESSCIGKLYMCCGPDRTHRSFLSEEAYSGIRRLSSLGSEAFGAKDGPVFWELQLNIPASTFGLEFFDGWTTRGNFYKCGDRLPERHFLSWAPIGTPKPDFHRPEFFDTITFER